MSWGYPTRIRTGLNFCPYGCEYAASVCGVDYVIACMDNGAVHYKDLLKSFDKHYVCHTSDMCHCRDVTTVYMLNSRCKIFIRYTLYPLDCCNAFELNVVKSSWPRVSSVYVCPKWEDSWQSYMNRIAKRSGHVMRDLITGNVIDV